MSLNNAVPTSTPGGSLAISSSQISYAAAPPTIDQSSILLANQLTSLANNNSAANGINPLLYAGNASSTTSSLPYQYDPNSAQNNHAFSQSQQQMIQQNIPYMNGGNIMPKIEPVQLNGSSSGSQLNGLHQSIPQQMQPQQQLHFNYHPNLVQQTFPANI
jgi:hypothetical protein